MFDRPGRIHGRGKIQRNLERIASTHPSHRRVMDDGFTKEEGKMCADPRKSRSHKADRHCVRVPVFIAIEAVNVEFERPTRRMSARGAAPGPRRRRLDSVTWRLLTPHGRVRMNLVSRIREDYTSRRHPAGGADNCARCPSTRSIAEGSSTAGC